MEELQQETDDTKLGTIDMPDNARCGKQIDEEALCEGYNRGAANNDAKPMASSNFTYCFINNNKTQDESPGGKSMNKETLTSRGLIHCFLHTLAAKLVLCRSFGFRLMRGEAKPQQTRIRLIGGFTLGFVSFCLVIFVRRVW